MRDGSKAASLVVGLGLAGLVIAGAVYFSTTQPAGENRKITADGPSGIELTNVELAREENDGTQKVAFDMNWVGDEFPGAYSCSWNVMDASGRVIGTYEDTVVSLSSSTQGMAVGVQVEGQPASANAACSDERLDVGVPYEYEFSDIRAKQTGINQVGVLFHEAWLGGESVPGVVSCSVEVLSSDVQIGRETVNFTSGETSADSSIHIDIPDLDSSSPDLSARIEDCSPFE